MLAALLLSTALIAERYRVPAHEYRFIPVHIGHWPAALSGTFEVLSGGPVRVELVAKNQLGNFVRGRSYEVIVALSERAKGRFQQALPEEGDYDFVLINPSRQADDIELRSDVEFASEPDVARYLSPQKRFAVIVTSLLTFAIAAGWSAWKLIHAMRGGAPVR